MIIYSADTILLTICDILAVMKFLKQFMKNPVQIGAIAASSEGLSRLIVESSELKNKRCIVELGAGTGSFTREILSKMSPGSTFFAIEINRQFIIDIKRECPNALVYHGSAIDIKKYLNKHNQISSDCIISGLPWAVFDKNLQEELMDVIYESLEVGGYFLTIAHITGLAFPPGRRFQKLLKSRFDQVHKTKIVWRNIFPGFVYHCVK